MASANAIALGIGCATAMASGMAGLTLPSQEDQLQGWIRHSKLCIQLQMHQMMEHSSQMLSLSGYMVDSNS
jgi:hypothetical protein